MAPAPPGGNVGPLRASQSATTPCADLLSRPAPWGGVFSLPSHRTAG